MADPAPKNDVFVSYNRADRAAVDALVARLQEHAGMRVWLDRSQLTPGSDIWDEQIAQAMRESASALVVLGPSGLGGVQREEAALAREHVRSRPGFQLITALLPGAELPETSWANIHTWLQFKSGIDEPAPFAQLVAAIKGEAPPGEVTGQLPDEPAPYRGLAAFAEDDARFFHGREAVVDGLLERLGHHPFLAVIGASGSGKTSLIQAGLLARLAGGALPGSDGWPRLLVRPGANPLRSLAVELATLQPGGDPLAAADQLAQRLQRKPDDLGFIIEALLAARGGTGTRAVLVIDRVEELYTLCEDEAQRQGFLDEVLSLVKPSDPRVWVVLVMRADFYARVGEHSQLRQQVAAHQVYLEPLERQALDAVIGEPARSVGAHFEVGLAQQIAEDAVARGDSGGTLPLLQHTLARLWQEREGSWFTWRAYREIGGVAGALRSHADGVVAALAPDERGLARRMLMRLVWLDPAEAGLATRRIDQDTLLDTVADRRSAEHVLERLADARLVVLHEEDEEPSVGLVHDTLTIHWEQLRAWVQEDREFLLWRQRLRGNLREWERTERDAGGLLRGRALAEAAAWLEQRGDELAAGESELIAASSRLRDEEEAARVAAQMASERLRRRISIGLAAGIVITAALAFNAVREARRAQALVDLSLVAANTLVADLGRGIRPIIGTQSDTVEQILASAEEVYASLQKAAGDDIRVLSGANVMLSDSAQIHAELGNTAEALERVAASIEISRQLVEREPDSLLHRNNLASDLIFQGRTLRNEGRLQDARAPLEEALTVLQAIVDAAPDDANWRRQLSVAQTDLGDLHAQLGDPDAAMALYERGLGIIMEINEDEGLPPEWVRDVPVAYGKMADILLKQGRADAALDAYGQGLAILEDVADSNPNDVVWQRDISFLHGRIGNAHLALGDPDSAVASYRSALAIAQRLTAADPSNTSHQRDVSIGHNKVGDTLRSMGRNAEALAEYQAGRVVAERLLETDPSSSQAQRDLSISHGRVGAALQSLGRMDEALAEYQVGLEMAEGLAGQDETNHTVQHDLVIGTTKIAAIHLAAQRPQQALDFYDRALPIVERLAAVDPSNNTWQRDLFLTLYFRGQALFLVDRKDEALAAFQASARVARERIEALPDDSQWPGLHQDAAAAVAALGS